MQRNYVSAGGLFCFADQVSQSFMDDILDSNLSFQLMASKDHDKFENGEKWREHYQGSVTNYGYLASSLERQSVPLEEYESVWAAIQRVLGKRIGPMLLDQARHSLMGLHDRGGDALKLLRKYTTKTQTIEPYAGPSQFDEHLPVHSAGEYRSTVALQLAFIDTEPSMTQILLSFQAISPPDLLPFVQLIDQASVAGNLEVMILTGDLDEEKYQKDFRDIFLKKLGQRRAELIMELKEGEK